MGYEGMVGTNSPCTGQSLSNNDCKSDYKRKYDPAKIEVAVFGEDVLTTSGDVDGGAPFDINNWGNEWEG